MNRREKELLRLLYDTPDAEKLTGLVEYASPNVLGFLMFNRLGGVAYDSLRKSELLGKINREFRNVLRDTYEHNVIRNESYRQCVKEIAQLICASGCKAAMLKGACLCLKYPEGLRTSNDIDILVYQRDVTMIGELLAENGFVQGNIRNGEFIPATRKEIIESKMMRGETVPYIKKIDMPEIKYCEIDINFSLDFKTEDKNIVSEILENVILTTVNGVEIPTLSGEDFFIHLCSHLYKEATAMPWIRMKRDMTLYKYKDISVLLNEMDSDEIGKIFERAKNLQLEKICSFAIIQTSEIFKSTPQYAIKRAKESVSEDEKFMLRVVAPREKKTYLYKTENAEKRLFMVDRENDLMEERMYE